MSDIVAIAAFGKAGQHACRMRCTVATLAGRDHLVLLFVTGDTGDSLMLCIGLAVQFIGLLVTCRAHLVDGISRIRDSGGRVGLVTPFAVTCGHFRAVRFVALRTERYFAMRIVAETAGEAAVFALDLFQLDDLLCVAGEAFIGDIIGQLDNFRSMRIVVAAHTGGKIVMRFAAVALTAGRDDFLDRRRMAGMTILAADLGFVGAAIGGNRLRCCRVTFVTVGITQHRLWISRSGSQNRHPHQ